MGLSRALLFFVLSMAFIGIGVAQQITEENYIKVDNDIWKEYGRETSKASELRKANPEKADSISKVIQRIYDLAGKQNRDAAIKYASVPSGFERLYKVRKMIPRDSLRLIYEQDVPFEFKDTPTAKALEIHLYEDLVVIGSKYVDFEAKSLEGKNFKLSSEVGNYIYLTFWGTNCRPCRMENRFLSENYQRVPKELSIVSFSLDQHVEDREKASKADSIFWFNVSDDFGEFSRVKVQYQVQAIPASFLINREGVVIERFDGYNPDVDLIEKISKIIAKDKNAKY